MKQFFKELFEYSHYYNQKLGAAFMEHHGSIPEKAATLYSHILNAHRIWNNRIDSRQPSFGVWENHPLQDCGEIDKVNYKHSLLILDGFDPDQVVHYTNTRGDAFRNSIRDILFHIINHSTYHRGQIAMVFRQEGLSPLMTDYIFYRR